MRNAASKDAAFFVVRARGLFESQRRQVMEKLKLRGVADLTRYAVREGLTVL